MQITLNGETQTIDASLTANGLIESLGLTGKRLAIEVNEAIVPRSQFAAYTFSEGDVVEVVQAIGGG